MDEVSPLVNDFFRSVGEKVLPWIVEATLPFYAVQNDQIVRDRSGVFLRIGDDHFILTAAHDLKAIVENNIHLYVGWSEDEAVPVPIHDAVFHTSEEQSRDVAVIKLSHECAKHVASSSRPISLSQIAQQWPGDDGFFLVTGYPQEWLAVFPDRIESTPLNYLCRPYQGEDLPTDQFEFDPSLHFHLALPQRAISIQSYEESLLPSKKGIKGISGCGVWWIAGYSPAALKSWNPADVRLIGIEHRYWETQGAIAATKIEFMRNFLAGGFPNVVPAMKIVYP